MAARRAGSLTRRTLWTVAIGIGVVVALATVATYRYVYVQLEGQALEQLAAYVEERRGRESTIFSLAQDGLDSAAADYGARLDALARTDPGPRFEALFATLPDGTVRLRAPVFDRSGLTAFVGRHVALTDTLKRELLAAVDVLQHFGPAWQSRFANLYAVAPEGAVIMYWPANPWGRDASDWEIHGKLALAAPRAGGIVVARDDATPRPEAVSWSDLYYDYGVNDWMVSAVRPVNHTGGYVLSLGLDVLLSDLRDRVVASDAGGTYSLLFDRDGRLIAHPRYMEAILARSGGLSIDETGDEHLRRILDLARHRNPQAMLVENEADSEYLAITQLTGPDWYLVTVFPAKAIAARAIGSARLVLLFGVVALLAVTGLLHAVLRRQVAQPLDRLIQATERVATGRFEGDLDVDRDDELGRLARSFNAMAHEIDAREQTLSERGTLLADLNRQLERELAERRRAEEEVTRQREALHQSEKLNALGTLLAGVAHELNNPLSVVVARASLLEEIGVDQSSRGSIVKIRQAAERCARIVKTFLAMARQQAPERSSTQVETVLRGTLEVMDYGLRSTGVRVVKALSEDTPPILADADQIAQVFSNLVVNAQHALADSIGDRTIRLTTRHDADAGEVVVTVEDSGPGVPEAVRSRIFDPFFTTKPMGAGTGIGLSVSRGIVESHGGRIDVGASELGGAAFVVRLPVAGGEAPAPAAAETPAPTRHRKRILVVDDEAEIAAMIEDILTLDGHQVEATTSAETALERLRTTRFDLLFTDIVMPDLSGPALYARVQEMPAERRPEVVFVTGDTLGRTAQAFLAGGDYTVVEKPFAPSEIRDAVAVLG